MKIKTILFLLCGFVLSYLLLDCEAQQPKQDYRMTIENVLNDFEGKLKDEEQNPALTNSEELREEPVEDSQNKPVGKPVEMLKKPSQEIPGKQERKLASPKANQASSDQGSLLETKETDPGRILLDVLELKDMDIDDVLKLISKKSGLNIVKGRDVKGRITIYLKNVDVRDALRIILESNDLAYAEDGKIIRVMTAKDYELTYGHRFGEKTEIRTVQLKHASAADTINLLTQVKGVVGKVIADEKSNTLVLIDTPDKLDSMEELIRQIDVPIETKVFDLSYANAEEIAGKINEALTRNVGTVKFDARSNKVFVTDTPQKLKAVEEIIKAFDEKHKEVSIEAKIIQLTLSDQYKMGVDWEAIVSDYHALDLTGSFDILTSSDKKGKLSVGTISADDYTVLIEALDSVGTTNILSSPSITVINNEEAKILVGSTEPYVTTTTTTPASGATTTAESVNFIDVGVKLYVTPTIHNDGYITMQIKPEVSSVTRFLTTGNNNTIPVVETSEAETKVMVKDGVTIVIGGLIKDEKIETVNKVPLLGDIPLLGLAFRNKDKLLRKTEIIIFLTPKIISGDIETQRHFGSGT
ncbi:MAG: secretin N-terminal domain-containing protein [Candidatus Omnitrophota bacterium]